MTDRPVVTDDGSFVVAGRSFKIASATSYRQDLYVVELAEGAEIEALTNATTDNLHDLALRVLMRAWKSGKLFLLLAAMVVEDGVKWTVEEAQKNADFFADLTDPTDKQRLEGAMVGVLLSFFVSAEGYSRLSLMSSRAKEQGKAEPASQPPSRRRSRNASVERSTSGTGTKSSVS